MGNFSIFHWVWLLVLAIGAYFLFRLVVRVSKPQANEVANTFKFRTVVFLILAFAIPLWIITLPLFLFLAYRSYLAGDQAPHSANQAAPSPPPQGNSIAQEIAALHELLSKNAITEEEFNAQKRRILGA